MLDLQVYVELRGEMNVASIPVAACPPACVLDIASCPAHQGQGRHGHTRLGAPLEELYSEPWNQKLGNLYLHEEPPAASCHLEAQQLVDVLPAALIKKHQHMCTG